MARKAAEAGGVADGEVELFIVGAEFDEEVKGEVEGAVGVGVGAVDLVEDDDGAQADLEGLGEDKTGLGHRPFLGVDEEEDAVDKAEDALDFSGKVGVARGVDNINFVIFKENTSMFGKDGDPALFFLVVAVHDPFRNFFIVAEDVGLFEEAVEHGGFAMVDVGDDGDIANFFWREDVWLGHNFL